jgi:pilus assembly protein TadC
MDSVENPYALKRRRRLIVLSLFFYLTPAICTIAGGILGYLKRGWLWAFIGAVAGLVAGYVLTYVVFYLRARRYVSSANHD